MGNRGNRRIPEGTLSRFSDNDEINKYFADLPKTPDYWERQEVADQVLNIAVQLNDLRQERGATQAELAQQAGLQQQAVSRLERGFSLSTKIETLQRYLNALGYSLHLLVTDKETHERLG